MFYSRNKKANEYPCKPHFSIEKWDSSLNYKSVYRNDPKFSDRQFWANSVEEQSDQGLHCLLFHLHLFDKIL